MLQVCDISAAQREGAAQAVSAQLRALLRALLYLTKELPLRVLYLLLVARLRVIAPLICAESEAEATCQRSTAAG